MNNKLALYCRSGFEKECAAEITAKAAEKEIFGFARVKEDSGYVLFECYQLEDADRLAKEIPFRELIFARQMLVVGELLKDLPPEDRVTPIVGMLQGVITNGGELRVEVPDTNESKELTKFCRKLTVPLRSAMREARVLGKKRMRSVLWCTYSLSHRAAAMWVTPTVTTILRSTWGSRVSSSHPTRQVALR
ncbi:23S rRNA (cytidine(2498)-2'-O)-methyltransferase RlmM [Rouxiella badensis]|nr:23S rRNA (cytidine(2498)-2'-O)-methyltransferase RlmM [Rouxiella badensis]